jgi:phosphoribosylanthranilate isomerase
MIKVKICCIQSVDEARMAIEMGASAIGLVSEMPSGPGVISETDIAKIAAAIPPPIAIFLLTSKTATQEIIDQQHRCRVNVIQICDRVEPDVLIKLREELPGIGLVQVIHVVDNGSVEEAKRMAPFVDALLLDSGNQNLKIKVLGGTGRTHDWALSRTIVTAVSIPVFLAGGINANNIAEAISQVKPYGVDLCNGVRTNGQLDKDKLREFMALVLSQR